MDRCMETQPCCKHNLQSPFSRLYSIGRQSEIGAEDEMATR